MYSDHTAKLAKTFNARFKMYKERTFFGTAEYMMEVFDESPNELLPHIHSLMDREEHPFFKEILAVMVADVLPDKRSIEMLIEEYDADEADFNEMAGFEEYCRLYGNPFAKK